MRASAKLVIGVVSILGSMAWAPRAEASSASVEVSYYTPQFYLDYLVFYDPDGKPVYYEEDIAYFVPGEYAGHDALVAHFQDHADAYSRWFQETGHARLNYRLPLAHGGYQPSYYLGFPVFYDNRGLPIYYSGGTGYRVPSNAPGYAGLVRDYRQHAAEYRRWYQVRGRLFQWYRQPVHTSYYQPLYYEGSLVYFDDNSYPYYFLNVRRIHVASTHSLYNAYIAHYQENHAAYARWYQSGGDRYKTYRQPTLHRWQVAAGAPRASNGKAVSRTFTRRVGAVDRTEARPPVARPERTRPLVRERRPGPRPELREPRARPARDYVDCRQDPRHSSCQGRGTHQPESGQRPPANRRGKPSRHR